MLPTYKMHVHSEPYIKIATEALQNQRKTVIKVRKSATTRNPNQYTLLYIDNLDIPY